MLKSQGLQVRQDNKDIRFRIGVSTVDEALGKWSLPCIVVHSGYYMDAEIEWNANREETISINGDDNTLLDIVPAKTDFTFQYKISYHVKYQQHRRYAQLEFFRMFPRTFPLILDKDGETETLEFRRLRIIDMDGIVKGEKVYRQDFILQTHLRLEIEQARQELRSFNGIDVTVEPTKDIAGFIDQY